MSNKINSEKNKYIEEIRNANNFDELAIIIKSLLNDIIDFEGFLLGYVNYEENVFSIAHVDLPQKLSSLYSEDAKLKMVKISLDNDTLSCNAINNNKHILMDQINRETLSPYENKALAIFDYKSRYIFILRYENKPFAIINLYYFKKDNAISDSNKQKIINLISDYENLFYEVISEFLDKLKNVQLLKLSKNIDTIFNLAAIITNTLDFDEALALIVKEFEKLYNFEAINITIIDKEAQTMSLPVFDKRFTSKRKNWKEKYQKFKDALGRNDIPYEMSAGVACICAKNKTQVYVRDVQSIKHMPALKSDRLLFDILVPDLATSLLIPLIINNEPIGVISFLSFSKIIDLSDEEIQTIVNLSKFISTSINNAMLYAEVEKERAFSKSLLESAPYVIQVLDKEGKIIYVNPTYTKLFGFPPETIIGMNWIKAESVKNAKLDQDFLEALSGKIVQRDNFEFISLLNDTAYYLNLTLCPVISSDNEIESVLVIFFDNTEKYHAQQTLFKVLEELKEKDKVISEDLMLAKEIQTNLLSKDYLEYKNINVNLYFNPMIEVGGDIYDIFELKENYYRVLISDATGHGVQGALATMLIKSEYDKIKIFDLEPNAILKTFNNSFINSYYNLTVFFTAFLADIDLNTKKIKYASAGHPDQYCIINDKIKTLRVEGKMIGLMNNMEYGYGELDFDENSKLILFTDGLYEEFSPDGEELGEERIKNIIEHYKTKDINTIIEGIKNEVAQWRGEISKQYDDVLLLGVSPNYKNIK